MESDALYDTLWNVFDDSLDDMSDKENLVRRMKIFLIVFYAFCLLIMAIWGSKVIGHTYMIKCAVLILKVSMNLAASYYKILEYINDAMEDALLSFEETIGVLLFYELYCCICIMKERTYNSRWLLFKSFWLLIISIAWMFLFKYVNFVAKSQWVNLREVMWSGVFALLVLFLVVKILISLLNGWNFKQRLRGPNFFLIGLILIAVTSQLTKLSVHISRFVIQLTATERKYQCMESILGSGLSLIVAMTRAQQCDETFYKSTTAVPYLSTETCCLLECLFCTGVTLYRKFTVVCRKKGPKPQVDLQSPKTECYKWKNNITKSK